MTANSSYEFSFPFFAFSLCFILGGFSFLRTRSSTTKPKLPILDATLVNIEPERDPNGLLTGAMQIEYRVSEPDGLYKNVTRLVVLDHSQQPGPGTPMKVIQIGPDRYEPL